MTQAKVVELMPPDNVIRIGYKPSDLTGRGVEYLIHRPSSGIVARFYNGQLTVKVDGMEGFYCPTEIKGVDKG